MTYEILRKNRMNLSFLEDPTFKREYVFYGFFYEHTHHTAGFVFAERDLEDFIRKYQTDPVHQEEHTLPFNWSKWFDQNISKQTVRVFKVGHKLTSPVVIVKNYQMYRAFHRTKPFFP